MGRDSTFHSALDGGSFGPTPNSQEQRLEIEHSTQSFLSNEAPIKSLGWEGFWAVNRRKSRDTGAEMPGAPAPLPRLVLRVSAPLLFPRFLSFYNALESQEVNQQISQTLGRGGSLDPPLYNRR